MEYSCGKDIIALYNYDVDGLAITWFIYDST